MNVDEFTDPRDGRTYKILVAGSAVWMAENLDFRCRDSYAYDDLTENRRRFGLLYTRDAAALACPKGWRLPTAADWNELFLNAGGGDSVGLILKGETFGFKALLAGCRDFFGGYAGLGSKACFWSAEREGPFACYTALMKISDDVLCLSDSAACAFSVRCVLDD